MKEKGQVVVIFAIVAVVLLGLAALAIDGGRIYSERSRAQTGADAAALAAAMEGMKGGTGQDIIDAAQEVALANGFEDVEVVVNHPPAAGSAYAGDYSYYQVFITTTSESIFAGVVFGDELTNTVEAIARVQPGSVTSGDVLIVTTKRWCNALRLTGTANFNIINGGVFSNSPCDYGNGSYNHSGSGNLSITNSNMNIFGLVNLNGYDGDVTITGGNLNSNEDIIISGANSTVTVNSGGVWLGGTAPSNGVTTVPSGGVHQNYSPDPVVTRNFYDLPTPTCSVVRETQLKEISSGTVTLDPGSYQNGIRITGSANVTLNPGLYCLGGSGFVAKDSSIITGNGVTLYISSPTNGQFYHSASGALNLTAPTNLLDSSNNQWAGMLIYIKGCVSNPKPSGSSISDSLTDLRRCSCSSKVYITGTGNWYYVGTVWARDTVCYIRGTSNKTEGMHSVVICEEIELYGSGNVSITGDPEHNYGAGISLIQ